MACDATQIYRFCQYVCVSTGQQQQQKSSGAFKTGCQSKGYVLQSTITCSWRSVACAEMAFRLTLIGGVMGRSLPFGPPPSSKIW